jgi:hypothetical protein
LARQARKPGFSKASLWALLRGIALLLLFTNLSWGWALASVICNCADESGSQHACCYTDRRLECATEALDTNSLTQETEMCLHLWPQAEAQTISITTPIFIPAENHFQGVGILVAMAFTPEYTGVLPSSRSRPLYLTLSSLLI